MRIHHFGQTLVAPPAADLYAVYVFGGGDEYLALFADERTARLFAHTAQERRSNAAFLFGQYGHVDVPAVTVRRVPPGTWENVRRATVGGWPEVARLDGGIKRILAPAPR